MLIEKQAARLRAKTSPWDIDPTLVPTHARVSLDRIRRLQRALRNSGLPTLAGLPKGD